MTPTLAWRPPTLVVGNPVTFITERQADVLAGICRGHTNARIGTRLGISEETVRTHAKRLYRALNANDRAHAAALVCSGQVIVHVRDSGPFRSAA